MEKVAATISVTNVMNFAATDHGTRGMLFSLRKSRDRMFSRIADGLFDACAENETFFENEDNE